MPFDPPTTQTPEQADADAEIRAEIGVLCNADTFPSLTADQMSYLVKKAKRADQNGASINDPDWIPTYNLNYAVYNGWLLKANNGAKLSDVVNADQRVYRSQVYKQCSDQAKEWRKKLTGSVKVYAPQRSAGQIIPISPISPSLLPTEQQQENG